MRDNKVTAENLNLAERYFRPDIGLIKGKSTRTKPTPALSKATDLLEKLSRLKEDFKISADRMKVSGVKILVSILHNTCCRTAQPLSFNPNCEEFIAKLDELYNFCKKYNFNLGKIHAEKSFTKALEIFRN